ncbi:MULTISPECIES: hypothetical protein [unclassified Halomonas]|uniref:hypothetical protein n=1 Tax=unclassified Halomonas TaxID=2609666 RepID=UPI000AEEA48B|nr:MULTISPECIES: hypothetical protein [unclassified Halomonas]MBT2787303.1 hypothetical protein [Halomonas sp. ISL-106]MBT2796333.1 hypothetical protein [Halomonas sp. ISL-104]
MNIYLEAMTIHILKLHTSFGSLYRHLLDQREAVPGFGFVPLGVVPTPPAGVYERSLNSRDSLPRATKREL